ncbi:MAG: LiaI-LiaF-like domain-containing protein [Anaerolineae bacterium]
MNEDRIPESAKPILPQPFPDGERERAPRYRHERRSLFWPIVLIGIGVLMLLSNLGLFPESGWDVLWRFWPVALVALGLDVLIGRRSLGGAIASGVLILILVGVVIGVAFFAEQIPALVELTQPSKLQLQQVSHPMGTVETAKVTIDWTSAPGYLGALGDSGNLIEADVAYRGELVFRVTQENGNADVVLDSYLQNIPYSRLDFDDSDTEWNVKLHPGVTYDLWMDTSSGSCNFDLSQLRVGYLNLDSGSGSIEMKLPTASSFSGDLNTGSGSVVLVLPDGVGMRVTLISGSGSFQSGKRFDLVSGERGDDGVWETENYARADYKIDLTIDQGSGSIRIR